MKYAVQFEVVLDTKAKQDNLAQNIQDKIAGKMLWANSKNPNSVSTLLSEDDKPAINAVLRFENKAERDEVAAYVKDKIEKLPALAGTVKIHNCYHDEDRGGAIPCGEIQEI